ncbi:MAG: PAS domain S-box protein [Proteobacteria bacterium]|nr:PAS domain S-box protein [Pseudomonadota bacterium]
MVKKDKTEKPKRDKSDLLRFILGISTNFIIISPDEIDKGINDVLKAIGIFADVDRSYIFQFYDNGKKMSNTHEWCAEGVEPQIAELQEMSVDDLPWFDKKIKGFEVVHISDVDELPFEAEKEKKEFIKEGIQSLIVVPIISERSIIGFLGFDSTRNKKTWQDDIISLLMIVGEIFANAITKKKITTALSESESRYKALFEYANDAIFLIKDGVFVDCNTKTLNMFACARDNIIGHTPDRFSPFFQPDGSVSAEEARKNIQAALHGRPQFFEWEHLRYDGALFDAEVSLNRVEINNGKFIHAIVRDITERKRIEGLLYKERETFYSILQKAPYGVVLSDKDGKYTYINPEFTVITGYTLEDVPTGRDWFYKAFPGKELREEIKRIWMGDIPKRGVERAFCVACKDGQTKEINFRPTMLDDGRTITMLSDITERKQAEELFKTLAHNSPVGVYIVQTGRFKFVNPYFERITGYAESELLDKDAMILVIPDDRNLTREHVLEMLKGEKMSAHEVKVLRKTGETRWILQSITSIQFKGKPAVLGSFVDITEKKQMEEKLRTMSIIDELTQLYNRRGFFTLATQQMKILSRNKKEMLLFFIDLDGLKWINDTLGHQEGDLALIGTANILRETFRDADVMGRIGGDEFAILAVGTSEMTGALLEKRLQEHIDLHNNEIGIVHKLSMSVGVAIYNPECPSTIDELMSKADTSMYEEKKRKRSRQEFTR